MDSVIRITMTVKTVLKSLTIRLYNTKMQMWFPLKSAICHKEWRIYWLCEVFPFGRKSNIFILFQKF